MWELTSGGLTSLYSSINNKMDPFRCSFSPEECVVWTRSLSWEVLVVALAVAVTAAAAVVAG